MLLRANNIHNYTQVYISRRDKTENIVTWRITSIRIPMKTLYHSVINNYMNTIFRFECYLKTFFPFSYLNTSAMVKWIRWSVMQCN
jgi:hypothetical protein